MLKGSKTIKIMKGIKNRRVLTQVKAIWLLYYLFFAYKQTRNTDILWQHGNSSQKYCFCVVRSEHRIDILNAESIGKEHFNIFIAYLFLEKTVSFSDPIEKFKRDHQWCSIKKLLI